MSHRPVNLPLRQVPIVGYGADEPAMVEYRRRGTERALSLDNRGPLRWETDGSLHPDILQAYRRYGFYVFTGVLADDELDDIERDVAELLDRAPLERGGALDRHGQPALGSGLQGRNLVWAKVLGDDVGGTAAAHGRYPTRMNEPQPPPGAPDQVLQLVLGSLQFSEACLRVYGHPGLLRVAEAVNGSDFVPFNEAVWIKHPGLGGSVAWHQDGWTHWSSPSLDEDTHGFNFMAQLYGCNAANGLWVVPGSHRMGKVDIKRLAEEAGSDRLPDAVPLICEPGDVTMCNRQAVHGSFANTSPDVRVTINFGFHRRRSVLNVTSGGVHNPVTTYDAEYVRARSRLIAYAIDARRQRFPEETSYRYQPLAPEASRYRWTPEARADIRDYNLMDLGI
jgi:hypothetical protein